MTGERAYMPAAGRNVFLPLYDPCTTLLGMRRFLDGLIAQAELQPGLAVLDIGCGTGTLAVQIKLSYPGVDVIGLDPDSPALALAARKAQRAGVAVRFDRGFADALTYPDRAFDRVFSSMMFHHLRRDDRVKTLAEVGRVLKPGGRLEFLDLAGGTHNLLAQMLHGRQLNASAEDRLLRRMGEAGLIAARRLETRRTLIGPVAYYQATAP